MPRVHLICQLSSKMQCLTKFTRFVKCSAIFQLRIKKLKNSLSVLLQDNFTERKSIEGLIYRFVWHGKGVAVLANEIEDKFDLPDLIFAK